MVLVVDNYDSFTYNLVHLVAASTADVQVVRNDAVTVADVAAMAPAGILISPGPGRPADAGISEALDPRARPDGPHLRRLPRAPGHRRGLRRPRRPRRDAHARQDEPYPAQRRRASSQSVAPDFVATRYHSLVVDRASLPESLEITAETADGVIMGLRHRAHPVSGVQFHPESILTTEGGRIVGNWVAGLTDPGDAPR